jgi:hypothetical protein
MALHISHMNIMLRYLMKEGPQACFSVTFEHLSFEVFTMVKICIVLLYGAFNNTKMAAMENSVIGATLAPLIGD